MHTSSHAQALASPAAGGGPPVRRRREPPEQRLRLTNDHPPFLLSLPSAAGHRAASASSRRCPGARGRPTRVCSAAGAGGRSSGRRTKRLGLASASRHGHGGAGARWVRPPFCDGGPGSALDIAPDWHGFACHPLTPPGCPPPGCPPTLRFCTHRPHRADASAAATTSRTAATPKVHEVACVALASRALHGAPSMANTIEEVIATIGSASKFGAGACGARKPRRRLEGKPKMPLRPLGWWTA